jgi:hypothetical protein
MRMRTLRYAAAAGVMLLALALAAVAVPGGPAGPGSPASRPRILWGIGDQLGPALGSFLYRDGLAGMVTAWFNGPGDLDWMRQAEGPAVAEVYATGRAVELVVWLADDPQYAISERFQTDIRLLTALHKGPGPHYGPLYVVLFTEFETYQDGDPDYRTALMSAYRRAVAVIHDEYRLARVALGFGGYAWDGVHDRDLTPYRDEIAVSDFAAVQQMQPCDDEIDGRSVAVGKIRSAVRQLGAFGMPVMISHFKLWGDADCQRAAFERFAAEVFTVTSLTALARDGLFAWGFMADHYSTDPADDAVRRIANHRAGLRHSVEQPTAGLP